MRRCCSPRPVTRGAIIFTLGLDRFGEDARRQSQADREVLQVFGGGIREISIVESGGLMIKECPRHLTFGVKRLEFDSKLQTPSLAQSQQALEFTDST